MKIGNMHIKKSKSESNWWKYLLSFVIVLIHILPIYVLINMAFKTSTDFSSRLSLPTYYYLGNFTEVIKDGSIFRGYINTTIITVATITLEVICGCMTAYALARNQSKFNELIRKFVLGVMMIPSLSILVGVYSLIVNMGGVSTYWAIIAITVAFGLPMSIFLFTNFIVSIPNALDEAATIDGANVFQTFWYIILPQLKSVTVTVIILKGVSTWNDYLYPTYFLQAPDKYTIVLLIKQYFSDASVNLHGAAAAATLGMLPIIIIYLFLQKYFIQGTIDSAIK